MLILLVSSSTDTAPNWGAITAAMILPLLLIIPVAFVIRYQIRMMKDWGANLRRIADAVEEIAHRR